MKRAATALLILALAPASASADEAKQQITKPIWQDYQQYLARQNDARHGFFAVSKDGQNWGEAGCPKGQCPSDDVLKASAISRCQQFSANVPCLIFAEDKTILVPYEVKDYTAYGQ
jgi:hypothetical protein